MARIGRAEAELRINARGLALVFLLMSSFLGYLHELAQIILMLALAYGVIRLAEYLVERGS